MNGERFAMDKLLALATYSCVLICTSTPCCGREAEYAMSENKRLSPETNYTLIQSKFIIFNQRKLLSYESRNKDLTDELWVINPTKNEKKNIVEMQFSNIIKSKDETVMLFKTSDFQLTTPMYTGAPTKSIQTESVTTPMVTEAPTTPITTESITTPLVTEPGAPEISTEEDPNGTIMLIRHRRGAQGATVTTEQPTTSVAPTYADECSSNPCQNGGTCLDDVDSYTCNCVVGYNGSNCEIDIDECVGNPCLNGGTCHGHINSYTCTCVFGYAGPNCNIVINTCPVDTDRRNSTWNQTLPGQTVIQWCANNRSVEITRRCDNTGTWLLPSYNCVRDSVQNAQALVSALTNTSSSSGVENAVRALENVSSPNSQDVDGTLTDGELSSITSSLEAIALLVTTETLTDSATDDFLETASNLIDDSNSETLKTLLQESDTGGALIRVISATDKFAESLTKLVNASTDSNKTIKITKKNLALAIQKFQYEDVLFPNTSDNQINNRPWINESSSSIYLPAQSFPAQSGIQYVISTVMYRNISEALPATYEDIVYKGKYKTVNGPVLSLTITPPLPQLEQPVQATFKHRNTGYENPTCSYWQFQSTTPGYWSTDGCELVSSNTTHTKCKCNHLTNFAVLMSPVQEGSADSAGLRIASIVGISVSLLFLLVTLLVHYCVWRYVKSDMATILMNLCAALVVSYIVFLAGIDKPESKAFCTVVAVLLHYIYLVVFSLMLALSVEIALTLVHVFATEFRIKILLSLAWLMPAVVVAISVGVTRAEGYGNENFCWLSVGSGLIWAFVGPATAMIVITLVCLILVMRKLFKTTTREEKKTHDQIKTSVISLCILVPLMGISWIVGLFYINEGLSWTQYVYAVCYGLQGFFILVFHCLLNSQIRKALKSRNRRGESRNRNGASRSSTRSSSDNRLLQDSIIQSDHGKIGSQPAGLITFSTTMRRAALFDTESFETLSRNDTVEARDRFYRDDADSDMIENQIYGRRPNHPDMYLYA